MLQMLVCPDGAMPLLLVLEKGQGSEAGWSMALEPVGNWHKLS